MNRVIACLIVVAIFGILLFTVACGPTGYEAGSGDPNKAGAQESQEGITPEQKKPEPTPEDPVTGVAPAPAPKTD